MYPIQPFEKIKCAIVCISKSDVIPSFGKSLKTNCEILYLDIFSFKMGSKVSQQPLVCREFIMDKSISNKNFEQSNTSF